MGGVYLRFLNIRRNSYDFYVASFLFLSKSQPHYIPIFIPCAGWVASLSNGCFPFAKSENKRKGLKKEYVFSYDLLGCFVLRSCKH